MTGRPPKIVDDVGIAALAATQAGQVSVSQLAAHGLEHGAVWKRVRAGRLHRSMYGVYAVGAPRHDALARVWAAVLACEPICVLSHFTAAWLWGIVDDLGEVLHVSVPRTGRAGPAGIKAHRPRRLNDADRTEHGGIPVTTVARTLVDLAGVVSRRSLQRLVRQAEFRGVLDRAEVAACIERAGRRKGVRALREIVGLRATQPTNSSGEGAVLDALARHGVPAPEVNPVVVVNGRAWRPDFLWREQGFVLELDGTAAHSGPVARERDARRDADFAAAGLRLHRVSGTRFAREPLAVLQVVLSALAEPPSPLWAASLDG